MDHSLEVTHRVHAAPDAVWAVLTDLDHAAQTLSSVDRIERVSGPSYAVGTTWRETRTVFGKSQTETMWVTAVVDTQSTTVESDSRGVHYVSRFTLTPRGTDTELVMFFSGVQENPGMMAKIMWKIFGGLGLKATEKMIRQDLADIASAAQNRS